MKSKLKQLTFNIHIGFLSLTILSVLLKSFTVYNLEQNIQLSIYLVTGVTGLLMFFYYIKPFKRTGLYFAIYPVFSILALLAFLLRSFFLAFILSIFLSPFMIDQLEVEKDGILIVTPYQGFMTTCCKYEVKERKFFLFEKSLGLFRTRGPLDIETLNISYDEHTITIQNKVIFQDESDTKDVIIKR